MQLHLGRLTVAFTFSINRQIVVSKMEFGQYLKQRLIFGKEK